MTFSAFDTLSFAKRLVAAGVERSQAEAHAEAIRDAMAESVATKADIASLEARLGTRIAELKVPLLFAVFGAAGLLFAALEVFGGAVS